MRSLRHPNFRLFFGGQLISLIGTWMQNIAQAVLRVVESSENHPRAENYKLQITNYKWVFGRARLQPCRKGGRKIALASVANFNEIDCARKITNYKLLNLPILSLRPDT